MNRKTPLNLLYFISTLLIALILIACSEEDRDTLSMMSDMADKLEKLDDLEESKLDQHCLDKLNKATESVDNENVSPELQARMVGIFNGCVNAIEDELALTEKEFNSIDKDELCLKGVNELRGYLPKITSDIQEFASLPNITEEDRISVSTSFAFIGTNLIAKGNTAMMNRSIACALGFKETAEKP